VTRFTTVEKVEKLPNGLFHVITPEGNIFKGKKVVIATGYFDLPRYLNIPGEDLPHVSHYYDEAYKYSYTDVVLVGGANSVVEAALELYRTDARVTIVHRGDSFRKTVKYWLIPDVLNRIKEGRIGVRFNSEVTSIGARTLTIRNTETGEFETLPADFSFLLTGYLPDEHLLARCGVALDPETKVPAKNPETFETNVSGLYLCGTVTAGIFTEKVFIENGRDHAAAIADHIVGKQVRKVKELIERI
jgi:thioredoxin reductase (NADPH)